MDEIEVAKDRPYKRIDDRELKFDVYRPPQGDPSRNLPVVVFVHGEGPPEVIENSKDWGQFDGWGRLIALSGMMAVIFNRRSSHFFSRLSDPADDVDDLLDHVLDRLDIDPQRLGIWTCSGGAPFGMRAGFETLKPQPLEASCPVSPTSVPPAQKQTSGHRREKAWTVAGGMPLGLRPAAIFEDAEIHTSA